MMDYGPVWGLAVGLATALVLWLIKSSLEGFVDDRVGSVKKSVGSPNGNGNLMQMTERMLGYQLEQIHWQEQHDHLDDQRFQELQERLTALENRDNPRQ